MGLRGNDRGEKQPSASLPPFLSERERERDILVLFFNLQHFGDVIYSMVPAGTNGGDD